MNMSTTTTKRVIYVKQGTWWEFKGTLEEAKKLEGTFKHQEFEGEFGHQTIVSRERPMGFFRMDAESQWAIDKRLGILDWSGKPNE